MAIGWRRGRVMLIVWLPFRPVSTDGGTGEAAVMRLDYEIAVLEWSSAIVVCVCVSERENRKGKERNRESREKRDG